MIGGRVVGALVAREYGRDRQRELAKFTGMIVSREFDGLKGWIAGSRSFRIDVEKSRLAA
ncbi:hypothetical protein [Burkholderia pyrrocinia]|uniref:hypothetical protein n=1 Tax=Burkholderia pyrrocinia TaxID=60550 RepID=UPI00158D1063|nr:hypothetical protein [Burkholderia pyrrocinia]